MVGTILGFYLISLIPIPCAFAARAIRLSDDQLDGVYAEGFTVKFDVAVIQPQVVVPKAPSAPKIPTAPTSPQAPPTPTTPAVPTVNTTSNAVNNNGSSNTVIVSHNAQQFLSSLINVNAAGSMIPIMMNLMINIKSTVTHAINVNTLNMTSFYDTTATPSPSSTSNTAAPNTAATVSPQGAVSQPQPAGSSSILPAVITNPLLSSGALLTETLPVQKSQAAPGVSDPPPSNPVSQTTSNTSPVDWVSVTNNASETSKRSVSSLPVVDEPAAPTPWSNPVTSDQNNSSNPLVENDLPSLSSSDQSPPDLTNNSALATSENSPLDNSNSQNRLANPSDDNHSSVMEPVIHSGSHVQENFPNIPAGNNPSVMMPELQPANGGPSDGSCTPVANDPPVSTQEVGLSNDLQTTDTEVPRINDFSTSAVDVNLLNENPATVSTVPADSNTPVSSEPVTKSGGQNNLPNTPVEDNSVDNSPSSFSNPPAGNNPSVLTLESTSVDNGPSGGLNTSAENNFTALSAGVDPTGNTNSQPGASSVTLYNAPPVSTPEGSPADNTLPNDSYLPAVNDPTVTIPDVNPVDNGQTSGTSVPVLNDFSASVPDINPVDTHSAGTSTIPAAVAPPVVAVDTEFAGDIQINDSNVPAANNLLSGSFGEESLNNNSSDFSETPRTIDLYTPTTPEASLPTVTALNRSGMNVVLIGDQSQQYLSALVNVNSAGSLVPILINLVINIDSNVGSLSNHNELNFEDHYRFQIR
ncbi:MAG: hypothetical protein NC930_04925 [Candidatus Omnitrophica bacterium]|nr:hypothetical protein [Candidatus Omnitrophota bacterium]